MVCEWADDSQRFILENFDIIHDSPSEIYHYALPFCPSLSWLRKCYSSLLSHEFKVVKCLQSEWGTCSRTVFLDDIPCAHACWKDLVAVGFESGHITLLDGITGICMSVLSSHTGYANSVTFSSDGIFLVSGSNDKTANLWDVQTGGVIWTFHGHTGGVSSVSISLDCKMVASGSGDHTIQLWDAQTGECSCVIKGHSNHVYSVCFSPTNSQILRSASLDGTVQQWNVHGHQIGPTCQGNFVAFSSDGSHIVSWRWGGNIATVWDSDSGGVVARLQPSGREFRCCCFSPDGKFVAGCVDETIYIWDITNSDPYLVQTFIGHTQNITFLIFSSSLISSSLDKSIRFWQTDAPPMDPVAADSESTPITPASIESVSLQATDGIAISSDSDGVVKTWDISTGLCKEFFQTPAESSTWRDAQLIDGKVVFVWFESATINIYDTEKRELQTLDVPDFLWSTEDLRISGDKSKIFLLETNFIQAWSIQTGEVMGNVELESRPLCDSLIVDGSKVWACFIDSQIQGWDFGLLGSTPVLLSNTSPDRSYLHFVGTRQQHLSSSRIEDTNTGQEVFRLHGRHAVPSKARWDGRYLIAGYESGEVLILDFNHLSTQ